MKRHDRSAHACIFALLLVRIRQRQTINHVERVGPVRCAGPSQEQRRRIIKEARSTCYLCGRLKPSDELVLDHILPRSRGGTSRAENRAAACKPCDTFKGDRLLCELTWPG
jgi:5-methylcytosine-specific restriction endonuclease McrA